MYQLGEYVVYGMHGVCKVAQYAQRKVDGRQLQYLVLEPMEQTGAQFMVPTHNAVAMGKIRVVVSAEAFQKLLQSDAVRKDCWIEQENVRKQRYRELLNNADVGALLQMIRSLYIHKQAQMDAGRKFHLCDENFLRDAQRILEGEFSLAFQIPKEDVGGYIASLLK